MIDTSTAPRAYESLGTPSTWPTRAQKAITPVPVQCRPTPMTRPLGYGMVKAIEAQSNREALQRMEQSEFRKWCHRQDAIREQSERLDLGII